MQHFVSGGLFRRAMWKNMEPRCEVNYKLGLFAANGKANVAEGFKSGVLENKFLSI